jgi:membrane-associated phospholipid phosphatase
VAAYTLDFLPGVQSRYNLRDRTLLAATACLLTGAVTLTMKERMSVWRPDGSRDNSFPSGHTATAFAGAHLLYKMYRDESPWIALGGYAAATATGALRVVNNRHWVSDVAMGAGVAILSVEAACLLLPVWHRVLGVPTDGAQLTVLPTAVAGGAGVGLIYVF